MLCAMFFYKIQVFLNDKLWKIHFKAVRKK